MVVNTVPHVGKAVKWNSPLYGIEDQGWFFGLHSFTRYLKEAFFRGATLNQPPPGVSKEKGTRYLDVHENDELDEEQVADWASRLAAAEKAYVSVRETRRETFHLVR